MLAYGNNFFSIDASHIRAFVRTTGLARLDCITALIVRTLDSQGESITHAIKAVAPMDNLTMILFHVRSEAWAFSRPAFIREVNKEIQRGFLRQALRMAKGLQIVMFIGEGADGVKRGVWHWNERRLARMTAKRRRRNAGRRAWSQKVDDS